MGLDHKMPAQLDETIFKTHPKYSDVIVVVDPTEKFTCGHFTHLLIDEIIKRYNAYSEKQSITSVSQSDSEAKP